MQFVTIDCWPVTTPFDFRSELEKGNVLFFPSTPFPFPEESKKFLRTLEFADGAVHKNIAYKPTIDRVTGLDLDPDRRARLHDILRRYSHTVAQFATELLPQYARYWKLDYASFRPVEENGRGLPLNKRNDLIHTDAFPSRPTNGALILRVFTNIHLSKTRDWVTTDPFPVIAGRYAKHAGLDKIAAGATSMAGHLKDGLARFLQSIGLPVVHRSAYDQFMLRFHEYLKRNDDFQKNTPKYRFNFPAGSTWLTFTDVVPHSVLSGQHALEQTFIIARHSLANQEQAPVSVLERLCGKPLVSANN